MNATPNAGAVREGVPARKTLRMDQVRAITGDSRTTIWRKIRQGKFPAPVQTGSRSMAFYEDEIASYQASLPRVTYAAAA